MIQSKTSLQAKAYFDAALSKSDYYTHDQELEGYFHGKVAERLGINQKQADRTVFHALCDNVHPQTGKPLTPRLKEDRTVGYDINFHCPKSVSLLHVLAEDDRILNAFRASVRTTMQQIEVDMKSRVRMKGKNENRHTGELIYGEFVHQTARPVDGKMPDPHLHAHCFVFNTTWDAAEGRLKAGQFRDIKRDMPYYQAYFQKMLADNIAALGYDIRKTEKAFEVQQIAKDAVNLFSKRTDEIGRFAREKGITDPKELDQLGARTRAKKMAGHSMRELIADWKEQMAGIGTNGYASPREMARAALAPDMTIEQCVDQAIDHSFERVSVISERRLLAKAYHQAVDRAGASIKSINEQYKNHKSLFKVHDGYQTLVTTRGVQLEENRMLELARSGRGKLTPLKLFREHAAYEGLNKEQSLAVNHILSSPDRVTFLRGGAGTGKTTLTKTAVRELNACRKEVYLFAPTAEASRGVLREEGFENADTIAKLLSDKELQEKIKGQCIWVDEAGLLGTKDMGDILQLAKDKNARVILSGDPRQHTAVRRGDALRILQKMGGLSGASINRIYRQKPEAYRKAVNCIAEGDVKTGFAMLDKMGAIQELEPKAIIETLAQDYVSAIKDKKSALVISPTNQQAREIADGIRQKLKEKRLLGKREKVYEVYRNAYFTEAEKNDHRSYQEGQVIQFHQNVKGVKRGSRCVVRTIEEERIRIEDSTGMVHDLNTRNAARFDVYFKEKLHLAQKDLITITKNGFDKQDSRLNNGMTLQIKKITKEMDVIAVSPDGNGKEYILPKDYGNFKHAYCMTSYGAQGKTVDRVFVAQPAATFPATSQKQFYVSVSRGREAVTIYTDDKDELLEHAQRHGDRLSALELREMGKRKTTEFDLRPQMDIEPSIDPHIDIEIGDREPEI